METWWHWLRNKTYLASVPVCPLALNIIVVICDPYLESSFEFEQFFLPGQLSTFKCCAFWSLMSTMHSSMFRCSLRASCLQHSMETLKQLAPGWENSHDGVKLGLLAELSSLPRQLCAHVHGLRIELRRQISDCLSFWTTCLQLVGNHVEADVPSSTDVFFQVQSLLPSLLLTCFKCSYSWSRRNTVPRVELRNQFVVSQPIKLPWGNSSRDGLKVVTIEIIEIVTTIIVTTFKRCNNLNML